MFSLQQNWKFGFHEEGRASHPFDGLQLEEGPSFTWLLLVPPGGLFRERRSVASLSPESRRKPVWNCRNTYLLLTTEDRGCRRRAHLGGLGPRHVFDRVLSPWMFKVDRSHKIPKLLTTAFISANLACPLNCHKLDAQYKIHTKYTLKVHLPHP